MVRSSGLPLRPLRASLRGAFTLLLGLVGAPLAENLRDVCVLAGAGWGVSIVGLWLSIFLNVLGGGRLCDPLLQAALFGVGTLLLVGSCRSLGLGAYVCVRTVLRELQWGQSNAWGSFRGSPLGGFRVGRKGAIPEAPSLVVISTPLARVGEPGLNCRGTPKD